MLLETGLATPAEIAWAEVQAGNEARTEAGLREWADERRKEEEALWIPRLEHLRSVHGIGHAIRFAAHLENRSEVVRDWVTDVCEALR